MGASRHLKAIFTDRKLKMEVVANTIGKPRQSLINQMYRDTWKFAEVEEIASKLGCDIVFIDRETGKRY